MSVLQTTPDATQVLIVSTYMEVISVNVIKDLKEMGVIAKVCNCVIVYGCFILVIEVIQNIVFDDCIFLIIDIDECKNATYPCHRNATCNNTDGSYICDCHIGYDGNGTICTGMCFIFFNMLIYVPVLVLTMKTEIMEVLWHVVDSLVFWSTC